jgi:uncharacterized protein YybS (DUF2232 family)
MNRKAVIGLIRASALAAAFFLAGGAIPIAGAVATLFAPVPILIYAVGRTRPNLRASAAIAVAAVLVAVGAGPFAAAGYLAAFGIATAVMCLMLERHYSFERIVLVGAAAMLSAGSVAALALTGSPEALVKALRGELTSGMARGQELYRYLGMQSVVAADTQASVLELTMRLMPALAVLLAACSVLLNLRLFWRWVGSQRLNYQLFADLFKWSSAEWVIWILLATGFGMFIPVTAISDIALNGFICVAAIYFCQGLAIMGFYFQMLQVPSVVRGVIYFVTLAQPVVAAIVCLAGVFDMWVDFRRLKPPSQEAGSFGDFF